MKRVLEWLLGGILFLIPSNLFISFLTQTAYNRGLFIDYLLPKIYLSDFFVASFIICFFLWKLPKIAWKKISVVTLGLLVLLIIRQFFVENVIASIWYFIHLLLITGFAYCLFHSAELYRSNVVKYAILGTVFFQSALGLYQFYFQESFYGYHFLGEPNISRTIGIVRESFGEGEKALPYGTTAHPNVLAGILVFYLVIAFLYLKNKATYSFYYQVLFLAVVPLALATLWFSQSVSAFLALGIAIVIFALNYLFKKNLQITSRKLFLLAGVVFLIFPLLLNYFEAFSLPNFSISRRTLLNNAALQILLQNIFFGVGLNQFTVQLENYVQSAEVVRFVQPAHHVGLLWLTETGLLGLLLSIKVLYRYMKKTITCSPLLLCFLPIMVLDHYLLTLQSGLLLTVISLFFIQKSQE